MRDERGEVRGLLVVLGLVVLLAAGVFGFYRPGKSHRRAAGTVSPMAPTTTVLEAGRVAPPDAPAATPTAAAPGSISSPAAATSAVTAAPTGAKTAVPPPTTIATTPAATVATTPPTTAPRTCTVTMGNASPKRGTALDIVVTSNSVRAGVTGTIAPAAGVGHSYGFTGTTDDNGGATFTHDATPSDQPAGTSYKVSVTVGPSKATCSTTFTTT